MPLRLKLLVVMHVLLSMLGFAQFRLLIDMLWLPASTAIGSLAIAQSMLMGFWIGLGASRTWVRGLGWIAGSLYLALWPTLAITCLPHDARSDDFSFLEVSAPLVIMFVLLTAMFAAIFLLIRWRVAVLRHAPIESQPSRPPQFAIIHLLVVTTGLSLLLASSRAALTTEASSPWHTVAIYTLMLTTFVAIVVAVPWAILQPGRVWRRMLIVLVCSLAAGLAVSFVFYYRLQPFKPWHWWWIFLGQAVAIGLVPTLILVASLAIVRSCGYRLVRKRSISPVDPLQFTPSDLNSRAAVDG